MKNKNKGAKMTSKLSNEFYLLNSFLGEVKRNKIQRRPMAVMPYRMTDGKNYPVKVIQVEPTDWKKS